MPIKIEYQKSQEKIEQIKEYKTINHAVLKQYPSSLGTNCVSYAKSKKNIGIGFGSLQEKKEKIRTKEPKRGLIGITSEGPIGHLVVVEEVKKDTIIISEGNYRHGYITYREVLKSLIIGYL